MANRQCQNNPTGMAHGVSESNPKNGTGDHHDTHPLLTTHLQGELITQNRGRHPKEINDSSKCRSRQNKLLARKLSAKDKKGN